MDNAKQLSCVSDGPRHTGDVATVRVWRMLKLDRSTLKTALWIAILALAYGLTSWIGLRDALLPAHTSVIWPASGIALAACLAWGPRVWPGVWAVSLILNLWVAATPAGISAPGLAVAGSIAVGTTLQSGVTAFLLQRWVPGGLFARASAVFRFTGLVALGSILAPSWSAVSLVLAGFTSPGAYLDAWPSWWLGDLTGMLVFAPLLLQWREMLRVSRRRGWIPEAIGTCAAIIAISVLVYVGWASLGNPQYVLAFVALPCIVWIAFRFRPPGVALTAAFVSAIAVGAMSHDPGALQRDMSEDSYLLFQAFSGLVSVTGLALSAAITGQKQAEKAMRAEKARYLDLYDNAPDMLASVDANTAIITECNQTLAKLLGLTKDAIVGCSVFDLYHPDSRDAARRAFQAFQITGEGHFTELALARRNGNKLEVSVTASAVRDASGRILGSRTSWRDITARKVAERSLNESQQLWRTFIEQAPAAIAMFDQRMRYLAVSRRFISDAGFSPDIELYGASHYDVFPTMPAHWKAAHRRALAGEVVTCDDDQFEMPDGTVQWLRWEVRPWYDVGGLGGVVVFTEDVSRRKQASDELRQLNAELEQRVRERTTELEQLAREMEAQSLTDPLTTLPNRRALDHKLGVEVRLAIRHRVPLSLLLLDVDHFKHYNDSFGHPAGDAVLRAVGRLLAESTRTTDFAARWGGEEFAVLLRHTDEDGAVIVGERIRAAVAMAPWSHRGVTLSIGAATLSQTVASGARILAQADAALYEAKRRGRNRVVGASEVASHANDRQHQQSA